MLLYPYCPAECTNLIRPPDRRILLPRIAKVFDHCQADTDAILKHPLFPQSGAADISLLLLAKRPDTFTVTTDRDLFSALCASHSTAILFDVTAGRQGVVSYPE